jgi:hypothetical protein
MDGSALLNFPNSLDLPLARPLANQSLRWSQRLAFSGVSASSNRPLAQSLLATIYRPLAPLPLC